MASGSISSRENRRTIAVGILTVSDRASRGEYKDLSGPALQALIEEAIDARVVRVDVVPDDRALIRDKLIDWVDEQRLDLVLTTGGTGFAPRDITPEATVDVIDRDAPGFAEAMRAASLQVTPHAMLSRARTGIRGRTLIINLPGSPRAATENLNTIVKAIPHGIELLQEIRDANKRHDYAER